jgi:hypothetical protein
LRAPAGASSDGVALLLLNIHPTAPTTVRLGGGGAGAAPAIRVLQLQADTLASRTVRLDGAQLAIADDGSLPAFGALGGAAHDARVTLPPMSATFVAIPGAPAACR